MLRFTKKGIYCPAGDFYIDPWRPVEKAVITHAHSDHARWGSKRYLAHHDSEPIMRLRLGQEIALQTVGYNETIFINGIKISFHPAGHIIGSAQVRIEKDGEVWVVSGDYKIQDDNVCTPFDAVKCHTFITESTFGLPVYKWQPQAIVFQDINHWWEKNQTEGKVSVLCGYSLGKAQRLLKNIDASLGKIFAHGAIWNVHEAFQQAGVELPKIIRVTSEQTKKDYENALVIAPPSVGGTPWLKRFGKLSISVASGWMQVRGQARRRNVDRGFVLSDHADWNGLLKAIKATEAEKVYVTHGFTSIFSRYLNEIGIESEEVKTEYGSEEIETPQA